MKLDVRTIIIIIILGSMLMSAGLFSVARGFLSSVKGTKRWAWATVIQATGWLVTGALRGVIPDVISIVVGNGLIQLSLAMYFLILAQFNERPASAFRNYAVLTIYCALLWYFTQVTVNLNARNIIISITTAFFTLQSVRVLTYRKINRPPSHTFTAFIFALCGIYMLIRATYYGVWQPSVITSPYETNYINDISYLIFFAVATMLTFGFLLMCNERFISQQIEAENALQKNHDLLDKLLAQVPGAIYQYQLFPDGHSCFPFASQGIQNIYEVSPEQVRQDATDVFGLIHPEDAQAVIDSIKTSAGTLQAWELAYRVILPKQGMRWRFGQAMPEKLPDGSILWHGFISDMTERAQSEANNHQLQKELNANYQALQSSERRLRRLMNSSMIGIVQGNEMGVLKEANDVILEITGMSRGDLVDGKLNWFSLLPVASRSLHQQLLANVNNHEIVVPIECEILTNDGGTIPIMFGPTRLEGEANLWVGFVLDLREQKRIDKLKSEFISIVSHELRTPLTSIRGSLGLLEQGVAGELPPKVQQLIHIAHKNSQRLVGLVNDILDMEKLASGKMTMHMQRIDLTSLIQQAIEANASYAETHQVAYVMAAHPTIPLYVMADHDRLMQVCANLLSNAAKFAANKDKIQIRIIQEVNHYRVEIEDHGKGIPLNFRDRIFGKFAQADESATRQLEGAGLGLNITKTLIEKMNGTIGFESELNIATVFWFQLRQC